MYSAEQTSRSNTEWHPIRPIRWRELKDVTYLAEGAMCSCFTAELEGHGTVVIKRPSRHSNEAPTEIERQLDIEKAYLASLQHPHIVSLIGSGRRGLKHNFEPFLVLEYLAGNTLGNLISERRRGASDLPHFVMNGKKSYIPWALAMSWAEDLASALHYLHHEASKDYMYICRDLKPDNIGFTADGTLKIFDFGLAKRVARKSGGTDQRYMMTKRTGTIRYMAPEAFLGCRYNEKVDVYAWSHVVAEMLSLDVPYNHMGTQEFRETVAEGNRRPHVERRWPRSIKRLLRRCWDREPRARPSFGEILDSGVLRQAAGQEHSWFRHFRLRWPAASDRDGAGGGGADVGGYGSIAAAPSRGRNRVATFDAGDPNHRPPPPAADPELWNPVGTSEEEEAPVATVGGAAAAAAAAAAATATGSPPPRGAAAAAGAVVASEGEGSGDDGGSLGNSSTPVRLFRLGPLALPVCFFGGAARG